MNDVKVYNNIIAVDDHDNVIGAMPMFEAIEKGYNRRCSRAYVFNENGKILIQRRSKNVLKPLLLDVSMGGHVDAGETYYVAAVRELAEELSIDAALYPLIEVTPPYLGNGFFNALYKVKIPDDLSISYDEYEVAEIFWMTADEIDSLLRNEPETCANGLATSWLMYRDKLIAA